MAMKNCPECKKPMSDKAEACPGCGYKVEQRSASRNIAVAFIFLVVLVAVLYLLGLFPPR